MNKKVLIISYYWPPAGGGGVQRWLKMSKYFSSFGWAPIIFTVDQGEVPVEDKSLINEVPDDIEVLKVPIWEPYDLYKKFTRKKKGEKIYSGFINEKKSNNFTQNISVFIRGNFFIPDARMFWIRPSIKYLNKYLSTQKVDVIISTGPPHTTHRIAYYIKKKHDIPWVADFRDPWTKIDFYHQLKLTKFSDGLHKRMEKQVLSTATKIVTVSWSWAKDFEQISQRNDIQVITNGYDPQDFNSPKPELNSQFTICHIGSMNKDRNPAILWSVLKDLTNEMPEFLKNLKIVLIGNVDHSIIKSIQDNNLSSYLEKVDFLPHSEVIPILRAARVLLLPINNTPNSAGVLPGKLYEYMAAKRNILCIGPPDKDAARILRETKSGTIHDYTDYTGVKNRILDLFNAFQRNENLLESINIEQYSRKELAKKYTKFLESL